jgi:hypothetical protein
MITREAKRDRILEILKDRGPAGVTNRELNEVCFRFGARIFELRMRGWDIETRPEKRGLYRFVLLGRAEAA